MSYILEALKKAQAERQLGNAPTIHAPQPAQVAGAAADGVGAGRKPLLVGLGAGALVVIAGAALLWHRAPAPGPAAQPVQVAAAPSTASSSAAPAAAPALVTPAPAQPPASASSANAASSTLAVRAPEAPTAPTAPAAPRASEAHSAPASGRSVAGADARNTAAQPATPAPAPVARASAPEDGLPLLQQLPEAVQAQVPRVSFGGYMYSANPADRLVLIDKGLRHEGEEVAPGLVLEKLLPHAAVMNFRGTRYRVAI
jgi:general secretion pathway protein B